MHSANSNIVCAMPPLYNGSFHTPASKQADRAWNLQAQTVSQGLLCAQDCADTTILASYTHSLFNSRG